MRYKEEIKPIGGSVREINSDYIIYFGIIGIIIIMLIMRIILKNNKKRDN